MTEPETTPEPETVEAETPEPEADSETTAGADDYDDFSG